MHKQLAIFGPNHTIQQRPDGSVYCTCNPDPDNERECWALKRYDEQQWIARIDAAKRKDVKSPDLDQLRREQQEYVFGKKS